MEPAITGRHRHRIGRYLVTGRIGKGGMGMVYRCFDEALEREVAVKTLTVEGTLDSESLRRFEAEAKAAARLQHPNIVTVFELGEDRGRPFIAMELLPGVDLESVLRSGEVLLLAEKLDIVMQVCRGLSYAHEHDIVHRDIKPSNIRLLDDGTAKILDFGIAKWLGGTSLTKSGMMVGTLNYMSPEQVRGRPLDGRSDVFSVGVILYELFAGQRPFQGEGPTDVLYKIVNEAPPPLDPAAAGFSPALQAILDRALAKDPKERFSSAAALARALGEVLEAHNRAERGAAVPPEQVHAARRLLKEGRVEDSLRQLERLAATTPTSIEVRRVLRVATREVRRRSQGQETAVDSFPELDATYRPAPTERPGETVVQTPTVTSAIPATRMVAGRVRAGRPPGPLRSKPVLGGVALLLVAGGIAIWAGRGAPASTPASTPAPTPEARPAPTPEARPTAAVAVEAPRVPPTTPPASLAPALATVRVVSEPAGATVALDGQRLPGTTPLPISLDPRNEHRVAVSLDGYVAQELRVEKEHAPAELRARLEPAEPPGAIAVASTYPVDVTWKGKLLAHAELAPRLPLPAGRQTLSVSASAVFLRLELSVNVPPGGEAALTLPGLGKLSIRAHPDNCQVFIDGTFVDYPPILDRAVVAGSHAVSFQWPDGGKGQESVEVVAGKAAFVTGRKQ